MLLLWSYQEPSFEINIPMRNQFPNCLDSGIIVGQGRNIGLENLAKRINIGP